LNDDLKVVWKAIDEKFGKDTVMLDIRSLTPMSDYFIITSASNINQMQAIADDIEKELAKRDIRILHLEGYDSNWILMDFNNIVVHIFDNEAREFYDLERLWADAVKIDCSKV